MRHGTRNELLTASTAAHGVEGPRPLTLSGRGTSPAELLGGLWTNRDLCVTLARKDFVVRYRRASFGVLWAVAIPAVQAIVLAVILSRVTRFSVPHYPVYIFSGVVGWTYFATCLGTGSGAIVENSALSSRIYFPRAVLPLSACLSNVFALVISVALLVVVAVVAGAPLGWHSVLLVPACLLLIVFTTSLTLVFAAAQVYFRDVRYLVQAALLVWFYLVPIFYPLSLLHAHWVRMVVDLDPMTGPIELFHAGSVAASVSSTGIISALAWTVVMTGLALAMHCRFDRVFADLL